MPVDRLRVTTAHNTKTPHALLVQATRAEYLALCSQADPIARSVLCERLAQRMYQNAAVIFDLEEIVFDHSAYQAWQLKAGTRLHPRLGNPGCHEFRAEAGPVAVVFVRFVVGTGALPIIISSRDNGTHAATALNLAAFGLSSSPGAAGQASSPVCIRGCAAEDRHRKEPEIQRSRIADLGRYGFRLTIASGGWVIIFQVAGGRRTLPLSSSLQTNRRYPV